MTGRHHPSRPQLTGDALAWAVRGAICRAALRDAAVHAERRAGRLGEAMRAVTWMPALATAPKTSGPIASLAPTEPDEPTITFYRTSDGEASGTLLDALAGRSGHIVYVNGTDWTEDGQVRPGATVRVQPVRFGPVEATEPTRVTCPDCHDSGRDPWDDECHACDGAGTLPEHIAETDCTVGPDTDVDVDDLPPEPDAVEIESLTGIREQAYRAGALAALDDALNVAGVKPGVMRSYLSHLREDIAAGRWPAPGEVPA